MGTKKRYSMRMLSLRVAVAVIVVVGCAGAAYVLWSGAVQQETVHSKVLTEARTLNKEMQAAWDYIDEAQTAINTDKDGTYDFKNVYCAVAGKGIARRFTQNADGYVIRYVRENPRTGSDAPDDFERRALNHFTVGGSTEYYEMAEMDGQPVFRYSSVLLIRNNCLDCHGAPAGEKDVTGFIKEGMEIGDVAGAVSMVIPIKSYVKEAGEEQTRSLVFFVGLALVVAVVLSLLLRRWVAAPLEQANRQLASENEEQSNFLAIMSHELRTPLSSIIAFTDIWDKSDREKDPEEERLVGKIRDNSHTLLNMVNNTIDVARLEAGRLEVTLDEVDLVDVMGAAMAVAEPLAMKKGVTLTKSVDPAIPVMHSDGEALRKILVNLATNAVKFTDEGGTVTVSARMAERDGAVELEVADTGAGIAPEDRERIFEKFSQAKAAAGGGAVGAGGRYDKAGKAPGSGLGLYLVKSLAERLGGKVRLRSAPGKGSVFTVTVPVESTEVSTDEEGGIRG
ncbi:ATP-binding protein [uncultured Adlercreutzia sp.]|uniref:ATP-binding protein n=1 Tax=uncultured Adlercreutzia sp. TaxID=875803 RepID=UPI0026F3A842|nr:ATP-binding protein [uncultured Adlercreutzia sp.]